MTQLQTLEILELTDADTALEFHLTSRHYPPVHPDFFPAVRQAIAWANESKWDATIGLPNGRVLSVSSIIEQLHLQPFLASIDDAWEPTEPRTLCAEHSDTAADEIGEVTHCEVCGVKVWE